MAQLSRRPKRRARTGIAASSVIALALGAFSVVGPGPLATQAAAAEFTGGLRGDDGQGAVEKESQKASDLDTGGNSCTVSASPEPGGGSQAGFTWHTLEPSQVSKDKTQWGLSVAFDNSKDRTFADWSFTNSGRFRELLNAGTVPAMAAGQTLPFDKGPVTAKADESIDITASREQRNLNLDADLTEDEVKQFAQAGADNPVRYAWQGKYTKDNISGPFATRGQNAAFTAVVNPWPSENMECNPITVNWESFDKHVIVEGEETKVGHINIPALDEDSQGQDDSLSRMVVEAYDDNGKFIGTSNAKESGGSQRLRVDEKGDIYFTWPKYRGTDLAANKNVNFSVIALPRSVDQLQAAVKNNNFDVGAAFDSSNSLTRYNKPNVIDSKGFRLDDTEDHTPRYDQNEKKIISGVDGPRGPVNTGRQTVTFTQVPDLLKELAKKKADGGFEATVELDDTYVLEGWDVEMDEDYNVTVTSPENPMPNTFARPKITVEYSNGSTDEIQLFVLVDPNNTQVTDLVRPAVAKGLPNQEITSQIGTKPIMRGRKPVFPEKFEVDQSTVPEGWTVTVDPTGKVTAVAAYNDVPLGTTISPTVKATYPDQTTDEVEVRFQVIAEIKIPDYDRVTDRPGKAVTLTPTLPEKGLSGSETDQPPYRYSFANGELEYTVEDDSGTWHLTIDEDTGEITTTIPRTAPEGYILDVPVHTFYRVGETKMVPVTATITVLRSDIVPVYPVESTGPNEPVEHKVKDAPRGSTFSFGDLDGQPLLTKEEDGWTYSIDPKTGVVTATPPADSKPGDKKTITVKVATPDGSTPEVPVTTVVKLSNSWEAEPTYQAETVYPGETATLPVHFDNPDNAKLAKDKPFKLGDIPAGWDVSIDDKGTITATAPKGAKNGDAIDIPVTVTYEDGSTDTTKAKVTVIDVLEREIPFNTVYKYDPTVNQGTYKVETEGKPGKETLNKDRTWKRVEDPVDEVVVIGTKPMSEKVEWTEPIPYSTVIRENPNLAPGEVKVVQEGSNGEASYAAVFNGVNGEATVTETKARTEPTDRIVEHGPRLKDQELVTEATRKIPFETTIVFDDTLAAGEQVVDKQGVVGEEKVTSTQKLVDGKPSGDPVVQTTTVTEKQDAVIRVGTKTTGTNTETVKSEVPFGVKIEFDPNMAAGTSEVTTPGVPGEKTVTIKRDITNSQPGDPKITESVTQEPVDQVIKVGTKPTEASAKVSWTAQVPFAVETRPNSELAPGEVKVVQKGVPGEKTYTADFAATGSDATVTPEEKQTKDPINEVIEYGPTPADTSVVTKTEKPVPFGTKIVFDATLDSGTQVVDTQGELGIDEVTSTQKIVDGKPSGNPEVTTERTEEPVTQVIRVGTKTTGETTKTVEAQVPFGVKVEFDPTMPAGTSETVTEGKPGVKTITVTQKVTNSNPDGEATVEEKVTQAPVDQVIKVGTKPSEASSKVSWTAQVPFAVETRPNSELAPGEVKVVQKGVPGEKTYTADFAATGSDATVTPEEKQTKDPINEIIEYGPTPADTSVVTKTEKPVPFETKIVFDATLDSGTQVVDTQGELGIDEVTSTQKIVDGKPSGDPEVTTERTEEPVTQVIRVGTKTTGANTETFTTDAPFKVVVQYDPNMPAGQSEVTTPGVPGEKTVTITRNITNSNPDGDPQISEEITKQPIDEVITVGTKQATATDKVEWTEPIPFGTTLRPNPELKPGEVKVVQEGKNGEASYTATFSGTNGEATVQETKGRTEPVERIVEYGPRLKDQNLVTKTEKSVPFETKIVFDATLEAGTQVVDKQGELGIDEVTSTQKLVDGTPQGGPTVTTKRAKEPVAAEIRVGTKTTGETTKTVEAQVPFGVKVEFDPTMPAGTSETVTEGKPGVKTITVTQKVTNSNPDGEATVEEKVTQAPVDQVIKVGTKPTEASAKVSWTAQVPFAVETRPNSELAPGEVKVVQKGVPGEKTYTADFAATGSDATVTPEEKQTKDPINEVIEYGPTPADTSVVTKTEKPVPFGTKIVFDATLDSGTQVVDTQGELGIDEVTSTQKIVDGKPSGNPEVTTERTKEPVTQVIRVGTKTTGETTKTVEAQVPFGVKVEFDPTMPAGTSETVTEGKPGVKTITVTQKVTNSNPDGEATVEEKITQPPVDQVIKVGTKPTEASSKVSWTAQVPFAVETRPNSELAPGEVKVVQKGVPGEKTYTADFAATGSDATVTPEEKQTKDPINEIIEYGPTPADTSVVTKTEKPVPFETKIVFDATLEAGTQVVDTQGELGIDEVTSTQKIVGGKPSGNPEVTTERTKEPVTQVIRVGTKSKPVSADVDWNERTSFDTEVRVNPDLAPGETKVIQEGTPGEVKHTVKVTVDNGKVSREESTETISDPKPRIVDVGPTVGESELTDTHAQDISYETIIEEDPNLEAGKVVEDQAGVVGQKEITTTWKLVNGQPVGEPETSETVTKESQPRKVRVGTKCNCSTPSDPTPPTDPDSGKKGSSEKAERCVANAFATNSPLLWLLPIGLLAGVGYGVNEAFGPQIQSVSAEFNARINEALPHTDFGSSHGEQPEWVRGLQMQIDGINSQFAGFGEQLKPLGIALGAIAALALVGSLIAQACTEEGFDNGMTVWGIKDGSSVPGKRPQEWSSQE